jgi:hypothetical protein
MSSGQLLDIKPWERKIPRFAKCAQRGSCPEKRRTFLLYVGDFLADEGDF